MFIIKIRFIDNSSLDYISQYDDEPNKIKHGLQSGIPLEITEDNRTIIVVPQNILFVDIVEQQEKQNE